MADASLDRVLAFHRELVALSAAGLPVAHELGDEHREIEAKIRQINSSLSLRTGLGQPIEQAIAEDANLPPRYRAGLLAWLRCEQPTAVMDSISRQAITASDITHQINLALSQLCVIVILAYLAFIGLCLWTIPQIDAVYAQLDRPPNWVSALLTTLRAWLPVWGVALPVLLLGMTGIWRSRWSLFGWHRLPGASDYLAAANHADFADQLAELLENDLPLSESLPLAAPFSGSSSVESTLAAMARPGHRQGEVTHDRVNIASLPPMFHWALTQDQHPGSIAAALRFTALSYRKLADTRGRQWLVWFPALLGMLLAASLVLLYGLSVFLPVIWLLSDLALPGK